MKSITAFILALILSFSILLSVQAQAAETIWITASANSFKTGETITVYVNAVSVTPVQGFTFQIRYDPACLKPVNAASPIPGMNGLSLPQTEGLVDASFASTAPQSANGTLAEVYFVTLGGCQTGLLLESAALAVRNSSGFAAPLPGIKIGDSSLSLYIDSALGEESNPQLLGTPLALDPDSPAAGSSGSSAIGIVLLTIGIVIGVGFGLYKIVGSMGPATK